MDVLGDFFDCIEFRNFLDVFDLLDALESVTYDYDVLESAIMTY